MLPGMDEHRQLTVSALSAEQSDAVRRLADAAAAADGVAALGEHTLFGVTARPPGSGSLRHVLCYDGDTQVGYGQLDLSDPSSAVGELVVDPRYRGRGHGRALIETMIAAADGGSLRLWAHGDDDHARRLADSLGFARIRGLWQMRRPLADPLPDAEPPASVTVRPFRVGVDEEAWLDINRLAFSWHPEQGGITRDDLRRREAEDWFDPDGFFLAEFSDEPGTLAGFHWTKIHPSRDDRPALGEVYAIGVHPRARGLGLGRALSVIGLAHLHARGLSEALLYVEETNTGAIRMYTSLGFRHYDTDVMYRR